MRFHTCDYVLWHNWILRQGDNQVGSSYEPFKSIGSPDGQKTNSKRSGERKGLDRCKGESFLPRLLGCLWASVCQQLLGTKSSSWLTFSKKTGTHTHNHKELNSSHNRNELGRGPEPPAENSAQARVANSSTLYWASDPQTCRVVLRHQVCYLWCSNKKQIQATYINRAEAEKPV